MYKNYIKRIMDSILAITAFVISLPIMAIIAIGVRLDSKGPIIFKQKRIGKNCKSFEIYKFRTMYHNVKFGKNKNTRFGDFLKKTSLDELPQLINILKGEMSFIGPRPWIEDYNNYFTEREKRRSEVLPGLSGFAQVQGRNGISIKEKLEADIWYVDHISFSMDIKIFLKTILLVFKKSNSSITEKGIQNELNYLKRQYKKESENMAISNEILTDNKDIIGVYKIV